MSEGDRAAGGNAGSDDPGSDGSGPDTLESEGSGSNAPRGEDRPTRVAVACQGGGSHTAFGAGVLRGLFADWPDDHELVGISGTSGGAFNALVAWYGLVTADRETAVRRLGDLWDDVAATGPADRATNGWLVGYSRVESSGLPVPRVSPYFNPGSRAASDRIRRALERRVDFEAVPDLCGTDAPRLVVGTVDVNGGEFETFVDREVTADAVLASAAVPELFEAVEIDGHDHWDGLFSQNPPIDDLLTVSAERKPDELWVIQINPQERAETPTSPAEITDRRNELAGNISLNQELRFVERVNRWIDEGHLPESRFSRVGIRRIELGRELHCSTKVDRSRSFVEELIDLGERRAATFLDDL